MENKNTCICWECSDMRKRFQKIKKLVKSLERFYWLSCFYIQNYVNRSYDHFIFWWVWSYMSSHVQKAYKIINFQYLMKKLCDYVNSLLAIRKLFCFSFAIDAQAYPNCSKIRNCQYLWKEMSDLFVYFPCGYTHMETPKE